MNNEFQDIIDRLPERAPRSRLQPYHELIDELLRRGRTYREIASILEVNCQLRVSVSTIHDFVRMRHRSERAPNLRQGTNAVDVNPEGVTPNAQHPTVLKERSSQSDDVKRRISTLKQRPVADKARPEPYQYDPNVPLQLPSKAGKR